jgi:galactonate dehydratase
MHSSVPTATQLRAGMPNFSLLEYQWAEAPWRPDLITPPEQFEKGSIRVPETAGLGTELYEKASRAHR